MEVVNKYGADVLRLWVSSTDYFEDVRLGEEILKRITDAYRRIRNTFRFMLGNLYDFDPAANAMAYADLPEIDRWALYQLADLIDRCRAGYESYEFHRVYHAVHNFCAVELSAFYLDVLKDRLYTSTADAPGRRAAQTVLWTLTDALARLLAPILSHTCEEVWSFMPAVDEARAASVQLASFPVADPTWRDEALAARWEEILAVRDEVNRALEEAKQSGRVEKPLNARVTVTAPQKLHERLSTMGDQLASVFIVSQAELTMNGTDGAVHVTVDPAPGTRCERCWLVLPTVGNDPEHSSLCHRCVSAVRAAVA
jgi:isoleucyl-tRNA synthetase